MSIYINKPDELTHWGIKGQKWGVRRYQNEDGSLTPAGQKRYDKLETKREKISEKIDKYDGKILDARAKNRSKVETKYDKKIAKATEKNDSKRVDSLSKKKQDWLDDFDKGTGYLKTAQKIGKENRTKLLELKAKAISDPSIVKSKEYAKAKKWHEAQIISEAWYGRDMTTLQEAHYAALYNGKSWTRGWLDD